MADGEEEVEEGSRRIGNPEIRPSGVVKVKHFPRRLRRKVFQQKTARSMGAVKEEEKKKKKKKKNKKNEKKKK